MRPEVLAHDSANGFLLLSDFGDTLMLGGLDESSVDGLYARAMDTLLHIQGAATVCEGWQLPPYSGELLLQEMELFPAWYLKGRSGSRSARRQGLLQALFARLVASAREQPQVFVHRDYHSRNLMLLPDGALGVSTSRTP